MTSDFAALVGSVGTGMPGVRACVLVSRDGLPLGGYPDIEEERAMAIWARLASLGDIERGFTVVGSEVWAYTRRGPYSALVLADASTRPGVLLDQLDQMLLVAEEGRQVRKDGLRAPVREAPAREAPAARADAPEAARRFRFPLHREQRQGEPDEAAPVKAGKKEQGPKPVWVAAAAEVVSLAEHEVVADAETVAALDLSAMPDAADAAAGSVVAAAEPMVQEPAALEPEADQDPELGTGSEHEAHPDPEPEVDHMALAREFAGLITEMEGPQQ